MNSLFKETAHLFRAAALFAAGILVFLVVRAALVPKDFGELGHYRAGALVDARTRPMSFAGRAACEECHGDVAEVRKGSKHAGIGCEACHGALAAHAQDPTSVKPVLPDPAKLCLVCHADNVAKPAGFPHVDPKEHAGGEACTTCHKPHHPEPV